MKLYFARRTRATRPRWLLEELGVPYEKINLDLAAGEHKKPEYLAIHPLGAVPALVDGDVTMFESIAICMYIADKYLERGMAPAHGTPERAAYYQWMLFAATTLEPAISKYGAHTSYYPAEQRRADEVTAAQASLDTAAAPLAKAIARTGFVVGDHFTAADVIIGALLLWAGSMKMLAAHPELEAYAQRMRARPAWGRSQA